MGGGGSAFQHQPLTDTIFTLPALTNNIYLYVCKISDAYVWYQSKGVGGYFL